VEHLLHRLYGVDAPGRNCCVQRVFSSSTPSIQLSTCKLSSALR